MQSGGGRSCHSHQQPTFLAPIQQQKTYPLGTSRPKPGPRAIFSYGSSGLSCLTDLGNFCGSFKSKANTNLADLGFNFACYLRQKYPKCRAELKMYL